MNEIEQFRQAVYKLRDDGWLADWVEYVTVNATGSIYCFDKEPKFDGMYWVAGIGQFGTIECINLPKVPPDQYRLAIVKVK